MFETKTLKANGGTARRLLAFAQLNQMDFDSKLVELAERDLLTKQELDSLPMVLTGPEITALQHVMDWQGRAMLLDEGHAGGRKVALASAFLNGGRTLILVQPTYYAQWATMVREVWPDANISVFGNPRYAPKGTAYPRGVNFTEHPDMEADVFISSYGGIIWNDFVGKTIVDQTIVEEMDHLNAVNYKWTDAVQSLFHELPRPLLLQNVYNLPNDAGRDNMSSLQSGGSRALDFIGQMISKYLWAGIHTITPFTQGSPREVQDYLDRKNYSGVDMLKILNLFGVNSSLLDNVDGSKPPLTFFDDCIRLLQGDHHRKDSGLRRFTEREREMVEATGRSIPQLVSSALKDDVPSQTLVGQLKTTQWANLKAQHIKAIHGNMTNKTTKSLFLVENTDLERALRLQFGNQIDTAAPDPNLAQFRMAYPNWIAGYQAPNHNYTRCYNMMVTIDDLINYPAFLSISNFLFLADTPVSQEFYELVKQAADHEGTQIVITMIRSTFEEEIFKKIAEI